MVLAIFAASVLGSLHCAGMCGAFLAVAMGTDRENAGRLQATYHLGRLASYLVLGAMAGAAGSLVNVAGSLAGVRPLAAVLAGGTMVVFGVAALLRTSGVSVGHLPLPAGWTRLAQRGHGAAMALPPVTRALAIGLLTTMLPCGWLYAFAVTAAGTASVAKGALVMGVFWLGTLPVLVTLGAGLKRVSGALGRRLPVVTSVVLIVVGLWTLATRTLIDPVAVAARVQHKAEVEGEARTAAGTIGVPAGDHKPECCLDEGSEGEDTAGQAGHGTLPPTAEK